MSEKTALLPRDREGNPVQVLGRKTDGAQKITITDTSDRNAVAFDAAVLTGYATTDCYIAYGDATVTATTDDHFIEAYSRFHDSLVTGIDTDNHTHIAVIRKDADGVLELSELV